MTEEEERNRWEEPGGAAGGAPDRPGWLRTWTILGRPTRYLPSFLSLSKCLLLGCAIPRHTSLTAYWMSILSIAK